MSTNQGKSDPLPSFSEFLKLWQNQSDSPIRDFSEYIKSNPLLENVLNLGPCCVYMLNYQSMKYIYISSNMKNILGYDVKDIMNAGPQFFYGITHPEDLNELMNSTFKKITEYYFETAIEDRKKIRCSYDYRIKRADDKYIRLLQQTVVVDIDQEGRPLVDVGILSDITEYKKDSTISLFLTKYDQKDGFLTLKPGPEKHTKKDRISERELEILKLLMQGYSSKKIAEELSISVNTVRNHRQNLLEKTKTKNIAELVAFALSNSLI